MKIRTAAILLILACVAPASAAQGPDLGGLGAWIESRIEAKAAASLTVSVASGGKTVWEQSFGYADIASEKKATPDTAYSLASISKPITATALMILVERGKVDLDRPIGDYLGEAKIRAPVGDGKDVTVRRVLDHTSGLPLHYHFYYADEDREPPSMDETIRRYGTIVAAPGARYQYSNLGYGILGHVIARVSGRSYAAFLEAEIFRPLGMKRSAVGIPAPLKRHAAERYRRDRTPLPFYDFDHPGASAIYASARDLMRFAQFHLGRGPSEAPPLLSEESLRRLHTPIQGTYALGWGTGKVRGHDVVRHSGGMGGVTTMLTIVPDEDLVVIALANSATNLPRLVSNRLLRLLLKSRKDAPTASAKTAKSRPKQPTKPRRAATREAFHGAWIGSILTPAGEVPLTITVNESGPIQSRLGDAPATKLAGAKFSGGYLRGRLSGRLETVDLAVDHRLRVELEYRGDVLTGCVTAFTRPRKRTGSALPHWVELRKISDQSSGKE